MNGLAATLTDVPRLYVDLLGDYIQNRQTDQKDANRKAWEYLKTPSRVWRDRKKTIYPEGTKHPEVQDYFGGLVVYVGGAATLTALQELDLATLSSLLEWNRTNENYVKDRLFTRRILAGILVALGVIEPVLKLFEVHLHASEVFSWLHPLLSNPILVAIGLFAMVVTELTIRKHRRRFIEFGQLLSIAVAYRSKEATEAEPEAEKL